MYKFSRYWNRFAFLIITLGIKLIWDYTKGNNDIIRFQDLNYARFILCGKKCKQLKEIFLNNE